MFFFPLRKSETTSFAGIDGRIYYRADALSNIKRQDVNGPDVNGPDVNGANIND
jgi:hypothetical protein